MARLKNKPKEGRTLPEISTLHLDGEEITNIEAFNKFQELQTVSWLNDERIHFATDGTELDLLVTDGNFKRKIKHLQIDEQRAILARKYVAITYYQKMMRERQKSIGKSVRNMNFSNIVIEHRKTEILELFGRMYSIQEVHQTCLEDWGLEVTMSGLEQFRKSNLEKITEMQTEYTKNFTNVRLGYKRSRLDEYSWMYQETKDAYMKSKSRDDKKFMKDLLESIKREVEGDLIRVEGDIQMNIEATLNVHITREVMRRLPIHEIIITRLAAKTGINPLMMLYRLQKSYYAKFTGYSPLAPGETQDDLTTEYPSAFVYDLDKLQIMNQNRVISDGIQEQKFDQVIQVPEIKKTAVAPNLKDIIKAKMLEKRTDIENSKVMLSGEEYQKPLDE